MNMVTAYQTLEDRANDDFVEKYGPFECTRPDAWLGDGYYFWDTRIEWAHEWGKSAYRKSGYVIGETKLDISGCYDIMGNVEHEMEFERIFELLKSRLPSNEPEPRVSEVLAYLKKHTAFDYVGVRTYDEPSPLKVTYSSKRPASIGLHRRVQVCMIHMEGVSLQPFRVVFPNRYLDDETV